MTEGATPAPPGVRDALRRALQPAVTPRVVDGPVAGGVKPLRCVSCGTGIHVIPVHAKGICVDGAREVIDHLVSAPPERCHCGPRQYFDGG